MRTVLRLSACALVIASCANYRDQLDRAEAHYRAARYEAALTNLEDLETNFSHLDAYEQVRYRYVRGMTCERLGQHEEARHWLAVAREAAEQQPQALDEEARSILQRTITPFDEAAGSNVNPPDAGAPARPQAAVPSPAR